MKIKQRKLNEMHYYIAFIIFSISYPVINAQLDDNSTSYTVVQNTTEEEFTPVSIDANTSSYDTTAFLNFNETTPTGNTDQSIEYTNFERTTEHSYLDSSTETIQNQQTTVTLEMDTTTMAPTREALSSYVEPPPHPLGYCIRSRLRCSKIRRCCNGLCNFNKMRCP